MLRHHAVNSDVRAAEFPHAARMVPAGAVLFGGDQAGS
jgi:hypothetical protein